VADVARMFRLNLETLRHDTVIQSRYHDSDLDDIAAKLALRFGDDASGAITWEMRQLVLKRPPSHRAIV
jgi:hypothetical protein